MPGTTAYPTITLHDGKHQSAPKEFGSVGELYTASFTIGTEAANVINVAIQLQDISSSDLATRATLVAFLSDDANGDSVTATGPSSESAVGTDGVLTALVTKKVYLLTGESDGDIDIDITETGVATWYLILVMPDGRHVASGAITFA